MVGALVVGALVGSDVGSLVGTEVLGLVGRPPLGPTSGKVQPLIRRLIIASTLILKCLLFIILVPLAIFAISK